MDPLIYVAAATLVMLVLAILAYTRRSKVIVNEAAAAAARPRPMGQPVARRADGGPPGRRRGARQRMAAAARRQEDTNSDDEDDPEVDWREMVEEPEGKVGAKKLRKLQDKAEKKAQREAELEEREERKKREARREEERKREEAKQEAEEERKAEEERLRKEEQERKEYDEYLQMKASFQVDEEGEDRDECENSESLLTEFINYIKEKKVVMLEDLASNFKIKTQDAISRIQTLIEEDRLSGVMDDRGKFVHISREEYEAVAQFIKRRGRVSLTELAECSNQLINLDNSVAIATPSS